jgi:Uma2 family endonuclease
VIEQREYEYHDGHPVAKVSPKRTHSLVQMNFGEILRRCGNELGEVGAEWRFNLGAVDDTFTEFMPDMAFIGFERLDSLDDAAAEVPPGAPDIAVEIRSPGYRLAEIRRKIARYLACGGSLVLDVDQETRTIEAHTHAGIRTFNADEAFQSAAAPWLHFEVSEAFAGLDRKRRTPLQ